MLIIAEGPDGAGKTTFADECAKLSDEPATIVHRAQPEDGATYVNEYADLALLDASTSGLLIADRWHWGEMIYGPIYRGTSMFYSMLSNERLWVDLVLNRYGAVMCYLTEDADTLRDRNRRDGEDFLQEEDLLQVMRGYDEAHRTSDVFWRARTPESAVSCAMFAEALGGEFAGRQDIIGSPTAETVIVASCGSLFEPERTGAFNNELLRALRISAIANDVLLVDIERGGDLAFLEERRCVIAYGLDARTAVADVTPSVYVPRAHAFSVADAISTAMWHGGADVLR